MRSFITIIMILVGLTAAGSSPYSAAANEHLNIPFVLRNGSTAYLGLSLPGLGLNLTVDTQGGSLIYQTGPYQVRLTEIPIAQDHTSIRIQVQSLTGSPVALDGFSIRMRVSAVDIEGIWAPSAPVSSTTMLAAYWWDNVRTVSDANFGIPYIAASAGTGANIAALGLLRQDLAVDVEGDPLSGNYYELRLRARTPRRANSFDERFFFSNSSRFNWFDMAREYADWVDVRNGYRPFPVSERAFTPVYDTWYWSHDDVDEELYIATAPEASMMGMGTFLADAGWDAPVGEYDRWLMGRTGDYAPPKNKFRDLQNTFDYLRQAHHTGIQLWLQPFAVGRESFRYAQTQNLHIHVPKDRSSTFGWFGLSFTPFALSATVSTLENINLCPRNAGTIVYVRELFKQIAAEYKPEGYWLDFMEGLPTTCIAPHRHDYELFGTGFRRALETIKSTILARNPRPVVQFRAPYANLNTKAYANVWQTEDSPASFDKMRFNAMRMRPFSKGVVFASDQLYWPDTVDEATAAKFVSTAVMVGVPSYGINPLTAPPSTLAMIEAWLRFYRQHQRDLTQGRFGVFGSLRTPNHRIDGETATFAYFRTTTREPLAAQNRQTIYMVNVTNADRLISRVLVTASQTYSMKTLDRYLRPARDEVMLRARSDGTLDLNIRVEQGGVIVLTAL